MHRREREQENPDTEADTVDHGSRLRNRRTTVCPHPRAHCRLRAALSQLLGIGLQNGAKLYSFHELHGSPTLDDNRTIQMNCVGRGRRLQFTVRDAVHLQQQALPVGGHVDGEVRWVGACDDNGRLMLVVLHDAFELTDRVLPRNLKIRELDAMPLRAV